MKNIGQVKKSQGGFTLVELMATLTIIAILVTGIYAAIGGLKDDANKQEFTRLHRELLSNIQDYYSPTYNYTGITTQAMVDGRIVPKIMRRGSGSTASIAPPYGSATGSILVDSTRTDLFAVQYVGMPADTCAPDVSAVLEASLRVEVGAAAGSLTSVKDLTASPAVTPNKATLASLCGGFTGTYTLRTTQR
jgi:prepilin-type N-terminal cleavage/methylation domain-containing protein